MIASLYQSGSGSDGRLWRNSRHLGRSHTPDRNRCLRAQPHMLHFAVPDKAAAAQQIMRQQRARIRQPPFPQWYLKISLFRVMRIEADGNQNPLRAVAGMSSEIQNVVVECVVERRSEMRLERRFGAAQPVKRSDFPDNVARRVPVAGLELVFLGVPILLAPRQ